MVGKQNSIFSFNAFLEKEIPIVSNINGTIIRVQVPLCLCRKRAMGFTCL
jgi:hypothetical protein